MEIKKLLTATEIASFVEDIVSACIIAEGDKIDYLPHYKDYVERVYMLKYYAGMTFEDNDKAVEAAYGKEYDDVYSEINNLQYEAIIYAAEDRIRFLINSQSLTKYDKIIELLGNKTTLDNIIEKVTDSIDKVSNAFDGVDMKQFAEDIHGMKFDGSSESLVDALIKAKMIKGEE